MMTRRFATVVLFLLFAAAAWAADVTGTWKGDSQGPDGSTMTLTYTFKQDGTKLTGTALGPMGDPLPLDNGKVDGDKISFSVKVDFNGGMVISSAGTIKGDEITLKTTIEGAPDMPPMTLKRQK